MKGGGVGWRVEVFFYLLIYFFKHSTILEPTVSSKFELEDEEEQRVVRG